MDDKNILNRYFLLTFWFFLEFILLYNVYKVKLWIKPIRLLQLNLSTSLWIDFLMFFDPPLN